jgi:L-glutamine-phosphate cytidylyltransferase
MSSHVTLIILAAGRGTRLGSAGHGRPKGGVHLHGDALLAWQVRAAKAAGIRRIIVVRGYRADALPDCGADVEWMDNPFFDRTNMVASLWLTRDAWQDAIVVAYADIVYEPRVLEALLVGAGDARVVIDTMWRSYWEERFSDPLTDAETLRLSPASRILEIGKRPDSVDDVMGQYIGMTFFTGAGLRALSSTLDAAARAHMHARPGLHPQRAFPDLYMTDVLQAMIDQGHALQGIPVEGGWLEIDTPGDLALATRRSRVMTMSGLLEVLR